MNDNRENRNKNNSPESSKTKLVFGVIFGMVVLLNMIGSDSAGGAIFMIIIFAVILFFAVAAMKNAKAKENKSSDASTPHESVRPAASRSKGSAAIDLTQLVKQGESLSKRLTEKMRDDLTRCDDDHEHVEPNYAATPSEKRAEQLREMLKNGIIEKEEYNILMRKYGLK